MQGVFRLIWGCIGSGAIAIGVGGVLGIEGRVVAIDLSPLVVVVVAAYNVNRYCLHRPFSHHGFHSLLMLVFVEYAESFFLIYRTR